MLKALLEISQRHAGHAPWPMNWNTFGLVQMRVVIQRSVLNHLLTVFPAMASGQVDNICTNMTTERVLVSWSLDATVGAVGRMHPHHHQHQPHLVPLVMLSTMISIVPYRRPLMRPGGKSVPAPSPNICTPSVLKDELLRRIGSQAYRPYLWEAGWTRRMFWECASMFVKTDRSLLGIMSSLTSLWFPMKSRTIVLEMPLMEMPASNASAQSYVLRNILSQLLVCQLSRFYASTLVLKAC
mmetsp:Transcript_25905/g.74904  ORF Transcript_25905/g.74904 Transcript_25905/m.74904 type:complete len:240 (+) Transcript_25905:540-1259(+)